MEDITELSIQFKANENNFISIFAGTITSFNMGLRDLAGNSPSNQNQRGESKSAELDDIQPGSGSGSQSLAGQSNKQTPEYQNKNTFNPASPIYARGGIGDGRLWEAQQQRKREQEGKLKWDDKELSWWAKWQMSLTKFSPF